MPATCPVCLGTDVRHYGWSNHDGSEFDCAICGKYRITRTLQVTLDRSGDHDWLRPYLSAHTAQANESGVIAELTTANWESEARLHLGVPVSAKTARFLHYVGRHTNPGEFVPFEPTRWAPLLDAKGADEVGFIRRHLTQAGYIESGDALRGTSAAGVAELAPGVRLTVHGWDVIAPAGGQGTVGVGFVAMSFAPVLNDAFEVGIKAAIETDCGLRALRVDREEHNDQITDRILAGIRGSQFTVADVTGQRQGVYFEAGFAMGLGRIVIWSCREDDKDRIHFDTRQFNHVLWTDPTDLRVKLAARIRGTVAIPARP